LADVALKAGGIQILRMPKSAS
jgi:hypothetical protein